jgi:hypothetical protein
MTEKDDTARGVDQVRPESAERLALLGWSSASNPSRAAVASNEDQRHTGEDW